MPFWWAWKEIVIAMVQECIETLHPSTLHFACSTARCVFRSRSRTICSRANAQSLGTEGMKVCFRRHKLNIRKQSRKPATEKAITSRLHWISILLPHRAVSMGSDANGAEQGFARLDHHEMRSAEQIRAFNPCCPVSQRCRTESSCLTASITLSRSRAILPASFLTVE
jgi:hypothetical protein